MGLILRVTYFNLLPQVMYVRYSAKYFKNVFFNLSWYTSIKNKQICGKTGSLEGYNSLQELRGSTMFNI